MPPGTAIIILNAHREASNTTVSVSTNPVFDVALLVITVTAILLLTCMCYWAIKSK